MNTKYKEIFSTQGNNPLSKLYIKTPKLVERVFDNELKSFVVDIQGSSFHVSHISLPQLPKATLKLTESLLVLQLYITKNALMHIELQTTSFSSETRSKRSQRLIISSNFKQLNNTELHTQIPFIYDDSFASSGWYNVVINLLQLDPGFLSLERISIGPVCRCRRIWVMKSDVTLDDLPPIFTRGFTQSITIPDVQIEPCADAIDDTNLKQSSNSKRITSGSIQLAFGRRVYNSPDRKGKRPLTTTALQQAPAKGNSSTILQKPKTTACIRREKPISSSSDHRVVSNTSLYVSSPRTGPGFGRVSAHTSYLSTSNTLDRDSSIIRGSTFTSSEDTVSASQITTVYNNEIQENSFNIMIDDDLDESSVSNSIIYDPSRYRSNKESIEKDEIEDSYGRNWTRMEEEMDLFESTNPLCHINVGAESSRHSRTGTLNNRYQTPKDEKHSIIPSTGSTIHVYGIGLVDEEDTVNFDESEGSDDELSTFQQLKLQSECESEEEEEEGPMLIPTIRNHIGPKQSQSPLIGQERSSKQIESDEENESHSNQRYSSNDAYSTEEEEADEDSHEEYDDRCSDDEEVELIFDPMLNLYFNPATGKYYAAKS